ncbi:MAG TPA: 4-alpha-glucanotransferase [Terriglobales bacterium]|nr:4-alpha-glucanotransferase [Terriglobales bacterium]
MDRSPSRCRCWWQSLPFGPSGYGNSPYKPMSSFAGNALLSLMSAATLANCALDLVILLHFQAVRLMFLMPTGARRTPMN